MNKHNILVSQKGEYWSFLEEWGPEWIQNQAIDMEKEWCKTSQEHWFPVGLLKQRAGKSQKQDRKAWHKWAPFIDLPTTDPVNLCSYISDFLVSIAKIWNYLYGRKSKLKQFLVNKKFHYTGIGSFYGFFSFKNLCIIWEIQLRVI